MILPHLLRKSTCLVFAVAALLSLTGCQKADQSREITKLKDELESFQSQLKELKSNLPVEDNTASNDSSNPAKKRLVHLVWLKLKDGVDTRQLIAEIKKLDTIPEVHDLQVGKFQDLGDQRAMSDLDVVLHMSFFSEADYHSYQAHPVHQNLKKQVGNFVSEPPVTYDYWTE